MFKPGVTTDTSTMIYRYVMLGLPARRAGGTGRNSPNAIPRADGKGIFASLTGVPPRDSGFAASVAPAGRAKIARSPFHRRAAEANRHGGGLSDSSHGQV